MNEGSSTDSNTDTDVSMKLFKKKTFIEDIQHYSTTESYQLKHLLGFKNNSLGRHDFEGGPHLSRQRNKNGCCVKYL